MTRKSLKEADVYQFLYLIQIAIIHLELYGVLYSETERILNFPISRLKKLL